MTDPLERLQRQFIARCRAELEQLRTLAADDPELGLIAHRLAGAAGSFGYPEVSEAAAVVDELVRSGTDPAPDAILDLTACLERALAREPQPGRR